MNAMLVLRNDAQQLAQITLKVSSEKGVKQFQQHVASEHGDTVQFIFNNAGIAVLGSFLEVPQDMWEKCFNVNFHGVVHCTRAFLPMVLLSKYGHVVNTSSINGIWACLGPKDVESRAHTAYAASKFAVRGFTEALQHDLRMNGHKTVVVSCVHPGHVGTDIVTGMPSLKDMKMDAEGMATLRGTVKTLTKLGKGLASSDKEIDAMDAVMLQAEMARAFKEKAGVTAQQAADIIVDGVKAKSVRILVGEDAKIIDMVVRCWPTWCYRLPGFVWIGASIAIGELTRLGFYGLPLILAVSSCLLAYYFVG